MIWAMTIPVALRPRKCGNSVRQKPAVLYEIRRHDGTSLGLVIKFSDGTIVSAWQPDMGGSFRSWSADLPDGRHLTATASGGFLSGISQTQATASLPR